MKLLSAFLVAIVGLAVWSAPVGADETIKAPHILTVIGVISNSNRVAFDPFHDAFLKFHEKTFEKAFAFDRPALKALPQVSIKSRAADWPRSVTAKGPRLKDVMDVAGVLRNSRITLFALDGYAAVLESTERADRDWVIAIEVDGQPLGIGGRGPTWLLHDTGDGAITADAEANWVWSIFLIEAE